MEVIKKGTVNEGVPERCSDLVAIDEALKTLTRIDGRKGRVVELRFFGGLTIDETAEVLKISPETVRRDWKIPTFASRRCWVSTSFQYSAGHAGMYRARRIYRGEHAGVQQKTMIMVARSGQAIIIWPWPLSLRFLVRQGDTRGFLLRGGYPP